ncbi:hypothetical protein ACFYUY_01230 [Kitasatospora sp. NPDC004745]|uniref:hypothetical protein n=1 Tax=Kitasatospora sp. NPDC004745 TaxID=3364019 RepID=UPI00367CF367
MTTPAPLTSAQLHGLACIRCGGQDGELAPAGHAYTPSAPGRILYGWAVVGHPDCLRGDDDVETNPGDLRVAVDGYLEPATAPFTAALTLVWQAVRDLPMVDYQGRYMHRLLGSGSTLAVEQLLDERGAVELPLDLGAAGTTTVRIQRGDGLTRAQRTLARYTVEQLPPSPRGVSHWAVRDTQTGELVRDDDGEVRRFSTESGASEWRQRQGYLAGYRSMPGGVAR